jgi:uncharacterized lipoprotein YajG
MVGLVAACTHEERVTLSPPVVNVAPVSGAEQVNLDVVSQDKRVQFKDRVGTLRSSSMRIVADADVADLVRGAVASGLQKQGFALTAGGLILTVELENFYCDIYYATSASVSFTLRVRGDAGRTLYAHHYEGAGSAGSAIFDRNAAAKKALEEAVGAAIDQVMQDRSLQRALLSAKAAKRS